MEIYNHSRKHHIKGTPDIMWTFMIIFIVFSFSFNIFSTENSIFHTEKIELFYSRTKTTSPFKDTADYDIKRTLIIF